MAELNATHEAIYENVNSMPLFHGKTTHMDVSLAVSLSTSSMSIIIVLTVLEAINQTLGMVLLGWCW